MRHFVIFLFLLGVFLFIPIKIYAAESIRSFDVDILAHKDGTFEITEKIDYDLGDNRRHGIFRDIPLVSKVGDLDRIIEIDFKKILKDGKLESYSITNNQSQASVKIGKANVEITGSHLYTISYLVKNGIGSNYQDHDEIFWNVTGNSWQVPILQASVSLRTDFGISANKIVCYTGISGSVEKNCLISKNDPAVIKTAGILSAGEGFSVVWGFPKDTFPPSVLQKNNPAASETNLVSSTLLFGELIFWLVILNLILAPLIVFWYLKNKRKERFGAPPVNFEIPKDDLGRRVTPAEAGSIDIYSVDQNDIIATIFDLAIRKYLKIEQIQKKKVLGIFGEDEDYILTKLKDSSDGLLAFEEKLIDKIFENGKTSILSNLKKDFYKTFNEIENSVFQSLIDKNFYTKNPKTQMTGLLILGILVIFIGGVFLAPVLLYLSRKLNGRTYKGDEMDFKIDGLKIFLNNMKRYYSFGAKNLLTIEEFIPYAIAFGYIKEFMEQLKVIYPNYQPNWYSGNLAFYSISNDVIKSMSSNLTTHAPSSSSGFSGGSSGGGGGGGGGGSW